MAIQFGKPEAKPVRAKIAQTERPMGIPIDPTKPKHPGGRPKSANPKAVLNIRVDADVLARWKATGKGWQSRINDLLRLASL